MPSRSPASRHTSSADRARAATGARALASAEEARRDRDGWARAGRAGLVREEEGEEVVPAPPTSSGDFGSVVAGRGALAGTVVGPRPKKAPPPPQLPPPCPPIAHRAGVVLARDRGVAGRGPTVSAASPSGVTGGVGPSPSPAPPPPPPPPPPSALAAAAAAASRCGAAGRRGGPGAARGATGVIPPGGVAGSTEKEAPWTRA